MTTQSDGMTPQQKIQVGIAAWERDDYMAALEAFLDVIREHPRFPDVHNRAGLCMAMLGNSEGALEKFEKAIEIAPTYAEAHFNRGIVLNDMGRHDEAREALQRAQELDTRDGMKFPSHVGNQIAVTHAELGDLYMLADRPDRAVEQYEGALEVRPRYLDIRAKLGGALLDDGKLERAREQLEKVVDGNPRFLEARLKLGVALQRQGKTDEAVTQWRTCLEQDPDNMRARAYLASAGASVEES